MTKAEADAIIAKIYDKMNKENAMAITDGKKEMGFSEYVDLDLVKKIVRESAHDKIVNLPSVTPQEPQTFKWCTDCKEYDQEKHCCHRWSKVIRDTVEEMKQEPILEQIRAEVIKYEGDCRLSVDEYPSCKQCTDNVFETIYAILDKYKAESEPQKSEDKG